MTEIDSSNFLYLVILATEVESHCRRTLWDEGHRLRHRWVDRAATVGPKSQ